MNKAWVLLQLTGAHHLLGDMIRDMQADTEDDGFPVFYAQLPFVYRHLNRAWNMRDATDDDVTEAQRTGTAKSQRSLGFPHDLDPFIHD